MNEQNFLIKTKQLLEQNYFLPQDGFEIKIGSKKKNNNTLHTTIDISRKNQNISLAFHIKYFYDSTPEEEAESIYHQYTQQIKNTMQVYDSTIQKLSQFDLCKEQICFKVINSDLNQDYLRNIPSIPVVNGLRAVFYVRLNENETITITNDLMKHWKLPKEDAVSILFDCASENTENLKPAALVSLTETVFNFFKEDFLPEYKTLTPEESATMRQQVNSINDFFMLTTKDNIFGATAILYQNGKQLTEALQEISKRTGHQINAAYILPSSIHEIILVPETKYFSPATLQSMVQSINQSHVRPEEILNNQIYHYDCQRGLKAVDIISKQRTQDISR